METIKKLWEEFKELTRSNLFIWGFPLISLCALVLFPSRLLAFILMAMWGLALIFNTNED